MNKKDHNDENLGPTGVILKNLPSPYLPYKNGLLHLPRFIAKIRIHLSEGLPKSYRRNFTRGFDGFLCLHLGVEPQRVIDAVANSISELSLESALEKLFPKDLKVAIWNRKLVQMGMSEMGRETLNQAKTNMGIQDRDDIISFCDIIEVDEGRLS